MYTISDKGEKVVKCRWKYTMLLDTVLDEVESVLKYRGLWGWWKLFLHHWLSLLAVDAVNNQTVNQPLCLSPTGFLHTASRAYITLNAAITSDYNTEHRATSQLSESNCCCLYPDGSEWVTRPRKIYGCHYSHRCCLAGTSGLVGL